MQTTHSSRSDPDDALDGIRTRAACPACWSHSSCDLGGLIEARQGRIEASAGSSRAAQVSNDAVHLAVDVDEASASHPSPWTMHTAARSPRARNSGLVCERLLVAVLVGAPRRS